MFKVTQLEESRLLPRLVLALPLTCSVTRGLELALSGPTFLHLDKEGGLDLLYRLRWTFMYLPAWPAFCLKQKHPPQAQALWLPGVDVGSPSPRSLIGLRWTCDPMRGLLWEFCWKCGKRTFLLGLLSWTDGRGDLRTLHGLLDPAVPDTSH